MTVSVVTYRKGGSSEAVTAAAQKLKTLATKYGAQQFMLNSVVAGADAGQWALIITFADWDTFGKSMQAASNDPAFMQVLSELDGVAELVSRRVVASVDL